VCIQVYSLRPPHFSLTGTVFLHLFSTYADESFPTPWPLFKEKVPFAIVLGPGFVVECRCWLVRFFFLNPNFFFLPLVVGSSSCFLSLFKAILFLLSVSFPSHRFFFSPSELLHNPGFYRSLSLPPRFPFDALTLGRFFFPLLFSSRFLPPQLFLTNDFTGLLLTTPPPPANPPSHLTDFPYPHE